MAYMDSGASPRSDGEHGLAGPFAHEDCGRKVTTRRRARAKQKFESQKSTNKPDMDLGVLSTDMGDIGRESAPARERDCSGGLRRAFSANFAV